MTKDEVRTEHLAAMARMDEGQVLALKRINRALRESRLGNCSAKDRLEVMFEQEAQARSEAPAD